MNKDRVVIEEGGTEYVFQKQDTKCVMKSGGGFCGTCHEMRPLTYQLCNELPSRWPCISATKIEPEPKMYFAWNREDARGLMGHVVKGHTAMSTVSGKVQDWVEGVLSDIDVYGSPFKVGTHNVCIIKEIEQIKLTRAELNEKYGVPDSVVIVD